jgi:hypothetical protein
MSYFRRTYNRPEGEFRLHYYDGSELLLLTGAAHQIPITGSQHGGDRKADVMAREKKGGVLDILLLIVYPQPSIEKAGEIMNFSQ